MTVSAKGKSIKKRVIAFSNQHPHIKPRVLILKKCLHLLDARPEFHLSAGELSVVFMTDEALARMHADFLDDPSPTDVITFPGETDLDDAGEICISLDRASIESQERGLPFEAELTLYAVHGWLHLAGYDDIDPADRIKMREAEAIAMQMIRDAGLL